MKESTKIIPNLNEMEHGSNFCNENYNGYDLSYLCVRYLNEILTAKEFQDLMLNFKLIENYGEHILTDMFEYFDNKINYKSL